MKETIRKLMYPKNRREYHEAFMEVYSQGKAKEGLIKQFGISYYEEVMRIHQERLEKDDFMIGPQSIEEWATYREKFKPV